MLQTFLAIVLLFLIVGCVNVTEYNKLAEYCKSIGGEPSRLLSQYNSDKKNFIDCQKGNKIYEIAIIDDKPGIKKEIDLTSFGRLTNLNNQFNDNNLSINEEYV